MIDAILIQYEELRGSTSGPQWFAVYEWFLPEQYDDIQRRATLRYSQLNKRSYIEDQTPDVRFLRSMSFRKLRKA